MTEDFLMLTLVCYLSAQPWNGSLDT